MLRRGRADARAVQQVVARPLHAPAGREEGAGRADGEMLLAMAKGLVVVDEQQQKLPDNFTLFTAASAQESAWSLPEAQHGTFSYFLMKGMEGNADLNGDKKLTNGELRDYLLDNVGRYAQQQQTPQMVGDPNQVLMSF